MRAFAILLLGGPVALILIGAACAYIPGAAQLLSDFFWSLLGEISIFKLASNMVQVLLGYQSFDTGIYFDAFMAVLVNGVADAAILSCCIFAIKSGCTFFNRTFHGRFLAPVWQMTLVGVIIGVAVIKIKSTLMPLFQSLLTLLICCGLFLYGIRLMLGRPTSSAVYNNRRAGFMIPMMVGILSDMFTAISAVMLITCIMEGPRCIRQGGSFLIWLGCSILSVVFLYVTNLITNALSAVQEV